MWNAESLPTISPDLWYLNLRGCKRLREIPQLPPKVQWLNAADCVQLESFATLSNILEQRLLLKQLPQKIKTFMQSNLGSCTFTAKIDINGESTIARSFSFEAKDVASAHVWLCYIPFIMFAYHQSPPFTCGVSMEHTSRGSVRCKSYGVHLVIPQDEHEDAW
ncbi:hypothetical protein M0R45_000494 [Rubus argutus]